MGHGLRITELLGEDAGRLRQGLGLGMLTSPCGEPGRLLQDPRPLQAVRARAGPDGPPQQVAPHPVAIGERPVVVQLGQHRQGSLRIMVKGPLNAGAQVGLLGLQAIQPHAHVRIEPFQVVLPRELQQIVQVGAAGVRLFSRGHQLLEGELADGLEQAVARVGSTVIPDDEALLDQRGERVEDIGDAAARTDDLRRLQRPATAKTAKQRNRACSCGSSRS